jgi:hypothetical protein
MTIAPAFQSTILTKKPKILKPKKVESNGGKTKKPSKRSR